MDLTGAPIPLIAAGLAALVLLVFMLRVVLRPKKRKLAAPTGLGLPASPKGSAGERGSTPAAAPAASTSAWSPKGDGGVSGAAATAASGYGSRDRHGIVTGSPAELAELASRPHAGVATASAPTAAMPRSSDGCPKCGGRFHYGEMEGPILMIDGIVREDFQPMLTARECGECGYLEFFTRPLNG
jgi:hypothetical protein